MESNYRDYSLTDSVKRIDDALRSPDANFEEADSIPVRSRLTYSNGFYVNCSAVFVDLRGSTKLSSELSPAKQARLYRSYLSECVALLNSDINTAEVNIAGDAVWAVLNTPYKPDIDSTFSTMARLASLVDILNCRYQKFGLPKVTAGIGASYGRALMIKAGYDGSGINEVVWMGPVVNEASKLSSYGQKEYSDQRIMVSNVFQSNLNAQNQALLSKNWNRDCYHGSVINLLMDAWLKANCHGQ